MNSIGIRVTPKIIYFSILQFEDDDNINVQVVDKIIIPNALYNTDKLSYIRTLLYTIINEFNVDNAILRRMEDNTKNIDIFRANVEGVIQELISNCRIKRYAAYKLSQLASKLGISLKEIKSCVEGENLLEFPDWDKLNKEGKESILCAMAAANF